MKLLYSDILPLGLEEDQTTIVDCFGDLISECDSVDIAVGYVSRLALEELDILISEHNIGHVSLIIGMYYIEGMPESTYRTAVALNEKWKATGIGSIRAVRPFKYHGKLYVFRKDGILSCHYWIRKFGRNQNDASNRRQYEVSGLTTDSSECSEISNLIEKLKDNRCSTDIADIADMPLIREINTSLTGVDTVDQVPQAEVEIYDRHKTDISFVLQLRFRLLLSAIWMTGSTIQNPI